MGLKAWERGILDTTAAKRDARWLTQESLTHRSVARQAGFLHAYSLNAIRALY
jgi:hypothetical protein